MTDAVIYARVSSKEQSEGFSIDAQLRLLREYADRFDFTILGEYVEVETAKQEGRPVFREMLSFLDAETDCAVLVEKTDRLYRNIRDWVTVDDLEVDIHFVKEGMVVGPKAKPSDKFFHGIKVLMAKNYIDNLREETLKGMNQKAINGGWSHRAPRGYRMVAGKLEVDPDEAEKVKWFFNRYAKGNDSVDDLITESGESLNRSRLYAQLRHPIYCGLVPWKGNLYQGIHEPLIDRTTWEHVQHLLTSRAKGHGSQEGIAYRKLIRCGHCGCLLTAERKKGRFVYYRCTEHKGRCKENGYIPQREMDRMFGEILDEVDTTWTPNGTTATIVKSCILELKRLFLEGDNWLRGRIVKATFWNSTCTSGSLYSSLIQPFEGMRKGIISDLAAPTGFEPVSPP